jgi:hypothetical protein
VADHLSSSLTTLKNAKDPLRYQAVEMSISYLWLKTLVFETQMSLQNENSKTARVEYNCLASLLYSPKGHDLR